MPIRPEAQRRLEAGFQRHIQRQTQRHLSQIEQSALFAREQHLGEVIGLYAVKIPNKWATLSGSFLILVTVCGPFGFVSLIQILRQSPTLPNILGGILFLLLLLGGIILAIAIIRRGPHYRWLYIFTDGFALGSHPVSNFVFTRWDSVKEVWNIWTNVFNFVSEDHDPWFVAYKICLTDGREIQIPRSYSNMLDPYPDVGPLIRGFVPQAVATTIPTFPRIDDIIDQFLILRFFREARANFDAGRTVVFGDVQVDSLGIQLQADRSVLFWNDIRQITFEKGILKIQRKSSRSSEQLPIAEIPNVAVLEHLLQEIRSSV